MEINPDDITEVAMPFMHETHLEEVAMLNELYVSLDKVEKGEEVPELAGQIEALLTHTQEHFAREEEKMLDLNFPPYPVHKKVHDGYLEGLNFRVKEWQHSGDISSLAMFLKEITPEWMQDHISTMDSVTADFFAMHEND